MTLEAGKDTAQLSGKEDTGRREEVGQGGGMAAGTQWGSEEGQGCSVSEGHQVAGKTIHSVPV